MTFVALILAGAAVGFGLATWWRVPSTPLLILIGIALNATGLLGPPATVQNALLLGLTFLVFVVGAELNLERVGQHRAAALGIGLAQFVLLGAVGLGRPCCWDSTCWRPSTWPWPSPPVQP